MPALGAGKTFARRIEDMDAATTLLPNRSTISFTLPDDSMNGMPRGSCMLSSIAQTAARGA